MFLTHSVRILPLNTAIRESIVSAIQANCSKIKNLVFAVLLANNKLVALVRMKNCSIHPADLRCVENYAFLPLIGAKRCIFFLFLCLMLSFILFRCIQSKFHINNDIRRVG